MSNHLLIETPKGNLSQLMHYINGSYANYINRRKGRRVRAGMVKRPQDYPYSSYRSFISQKKTEEIVKRDLIWGMISKTPKYASGQYRVFVEKAVDERLENPLRNVYGGAVLGGKRFIREALGRLKDDVLHKGEVSHRRELGAGFEAEEILYMVSRYLGVSVDDLTRGKGELRDMAIYVIKKYTGLTNLQIGAIFSGLSYSAVAKIHKRFSEKTEKDLTLKKRLTALMNNVSNVKG